MAVKSVFYALGTENAIITEDGSSKEAVAKVIERVYEIEDKMSVFKPSSEVSAIAGNAGTKPLKVSDDLFMVLKKAYEIGEASGGAFDITLGPITELWKFGRGNDIVPEKAKIIEAKKFVGYRYLHLDPPGKTAFLTRKGCSVDLGGIAKGYAADEARRILMDHGINKALINFGGNILAVGPSFDHASWKVAIQNPLSKRGDAVLTLDVTEKSVVTSAVNERFFIKDGVRYHHIISPMTGFPAQSGLLSVTVINKSSMLADALSTAAFVLGIEESLKLITHFDSEAVFITDKGEILSTFEI